MRKKNTERRSFSTETQLPENGDSSRDSLWDYLGRIKLHENNNNGKGEKNRNEETECVSC